MATISITSNKGTLDSVSAVLEVVATKPEYSRVTGEEKFIPTSFPLIK